LKTRSERSVAINIRKPDGRELVAAPDEAGGVLLTDIGHKSAS
jgi:hypothetical protein